jgi:uncharacterized membrane protein YgdD (TMEM256/DUF423 family)
MNHLLAARIAAGFAMVGVAYGAFGAHGLKVQLEANHSMETWKTAVLYHLIHSVAMYVLAVTRGSLRAWTLFGAGVLLFSGSLYALALWPDLRWLGPVTPVGGVLFIGGWATLMIKKAEEKGK